MHVKIFMAVLLIVAALAGCASIDDSNSGHSSGSSSSGHSY